MSSAHPSVAAPPESGAPGARVETSGRRVYFLAADGTRYRLYDAQWQEGRWVPFRPPHAAARFRLFVDAARRRRIHSFAPGERRDLVPELLERQLAGAAWGAIVPRFDPATHPPR